MAKFTDIFIQKPVLATVLSLLIFLVGLRAVFDLQIRQFPKIENTVINVTTVYAGASSDIIQGFITSPLEKNIAGADGIDYITSTSVEGVSTVSAFIKLNFDPNIAFTNIMSKVQETKSALPREADDPIVQQQTGDQIALMYLSFSSDKMNLEQITDYLTRAVQPKLETVGGVSQAEILGSQTFAMRIWLNTKRMAGLGIAPSDVFMALNNNNVQATAGSTKGLYVSFPVRPNTDLQTPEGFGNIVIKKNDKGAFIKLKDVAIVEMGAKNYDSSVYFNGKKAIFMAIRATPSANPLTVITDIKKTLPSVEASFPPTLHAAIVYDATQYIRSAITEVIHTLLEASIIVIVVIYLFLGSLRTVLIPVVTIPLSLIGVCILMLALGYSINLLTLLALVLAIGMVVDDAIVVVENIHRHIEAGLTPLNAAIRGAREIALPIIAMTLTLAAVYAPIGLMSGLTGALFKEFAFTLASAVIISGVIALTLSPMMCSKVLNEELSRHKLVHFIDNVFNRLKNRYQRILHGVLAYRLLLIVFAFVVLVSCVFLYMFSQKELAPQEDQGAVFVAMGGPQTATIDYMEKYSNLLNTVFQRIPAADSYFVINGEGGTNSGFGGIILKPWQYRKQSANQVMKDVQFMASQIPALEIHAFPLPSLPVGGNSIPLQFVISTTGPYSTIYPALQKLLTLAHKSGLFLFVMGDLKFDKPQIILEINREKAAQMGIDMAQIAQALGITLGGNSVNRFSVEGQSYQVIPQVLRIDRMNPKDTQQIYVRTQNGNLVPLSVFTTIKMITQPNTLARFNQLNSATIQGMMMPGHTLSEGLDFLRSHAEQIFPGGMSYNYSGQSRQLVQEGSALMYTFFFSIIFIYLVLAAQFESFRDPLVIMISVPMAICGALLPINWGIASINIYTQIGLITLIGLISKHGILMVDFANQLRRTTPNLTPQEAIEQAAAIRLRPVLMTTFAMILGVVPLLLASGAGAISRFDIGIVIACGMAIGTLFTLFIVPTMYTLKTKQILLFLLSVAAGSLLCYGIVTAL